MAGIRVRSIPKNKVDKHLRIHFSKPENGGGKIRKIYFPLFNNDAVILFEDRTVVDNVLKEDHQLGSHIVEVQGLPEHMVFATMDAKLDDAASIIVQVTPALRDEMEYSEGIKLIQESDQTYRLHGNWFQLEWAWHYIDCFMQQQEVIQHEISQQPQRYAGQPMEVEQDDAQEDYGRAAADRQVSTSPTEVNTALRRHIAQRSQHEESLKGARQKPRELQSDRSAHFDDDIADDLSYREKHETKRSAQKADDVVESLSYREKHDTKRSAQNADAIVESLSFREHHDNKQANRSFVEYRDPKNLLSDDDYDSNASASLKSVLTADKGMLKLNSANGNESYDVNDRSRRSRQDSEDELLGSGHSIPFESMQSKIDTTEAVRRSKDENSTFQEFSGLHSLSNISNDKSYKKSFKEENSSRVSAHHENNTSLESHNSLSSSQKKTSSLSPERKEGYVRSRKPSVDAVDQFLGLNKPRLPGQSIDIPARYTEDQLCHTFDIRGVKVTIYFGNLIDEETDAIVNAANEQLDHNGGIAYAILKARGREMEEECRKFVRTNGRLKTSEVHHTSGGGKIKSGHIIHAAGPMWLSERWKEEFTNQLTQTFLNCLMHAEKTLWIKSIALPVISSGVHGAPLDLCVRCFLDAVLIFTHQQESGGRLVDIRLVNNDAESTVTSIVLVQTLLDHGIGTLTGDAEEGMAKYANKDRKLNLPRGRPEGERDFTKTYSKGFTSDLGQSALGLSSSGGDKWTTPPRRRSSSLSRAADKREPSGEIRKYDHQKGEFVTESKTKQIPTTGDRISDRHRERSESMNTRPQKDSSQSLRNTLSGATGTKIAESLRQSSRQTSSEESSRKSPPKIKSALLSSHKLKVKSQTSSPKRADRFGQLTSDDYGAFTRTEKPKSSYLHHTDTSEDDEDFGMQSLPADLHKHSSYREKFLHSSSSKPEVCAICLYDVKDPKQLSKCNHKFCRECIQRHFRSSKPSCPTCGVLYGKVIGDQPRAGQMTHVTDRTRCLPGYEQEDGMIVITYLFPDGIQESCHPQPGRSYKGLTRKAFLPNCVEGREVLRLLKKAFDARLVFTIGDSKTSGKRDVLTWNDIHHKTSVGGGPTRYGYPDSGYLKRVKDELAAKGITNEK